MWGRILKSKLALYIVVCYLFGIIVSDRFLFCDLFLFVSENSQYFLLSCVIVTFLTLFIIVLSVFGRNWLNDFSFNLYFCISIFFIFTLLGVQRAIDYNLSVDTSLERKLFEKSDSLKAKFSIFVSKTLSGEEGVDTSISKNKSQSKRKSIIKFQCSDNQNISLITALLVGDKSSLSREIKENFRNAGVSHTLALSGLHIGIIWSFLNCILFFLGGSLRTRKIKLYLIISLIFFYSFVTGLSNSVVRAAIMLTIWQLNNIYGRKNSGANSIISTAFIILLINPSSIYSISFQLSFAAVCGIVVLFPTIKESIEWMFSKNFVEMESVTKMQGFQEIQGVKDVKGFKEVRAFKVLRHLGKKFLLYIFQLIGISIACQIFTLPIILYYFGTSAPYFLISNLFVIPTVAITVYSSAFTLVVALFGTIGFAICNVIGITFNITFCECELFATTLQTLSAITNNIAAWLLSLVQFLAV